MPCLSDNTTSTDLYGPAPFSVSSSGDCILQSSDGIKYKVWRNILSLSSPVFSDMFDLPQGDTPLSELPVIEISEAADVLQTLLLLLYPATTPQIRSYELAFALISAYDKYIINVDSLRPFLFSNLMSDKAFETNALAVYGLAWRMGLREEAMRASRYIHAQNIKKPEVQNDLISRTGQVAALVALWDLRQRREVALDAFIEALPLDTYRCPNHAGLTPNDGTKLRAKARLALTAAHPSCLQVMQALSIQNTLTVPPAVDATKRVDTSSFGRSAFVALNSPAGRGPLSPCAECKHAMNFSSSDVVNSRMRMVESAVNAFPQTIDWSTS